MRKIGYLNQPFDCAVQNSLSAIKQAHIELQLLTGACTTPTVLASQIELCDVLLGEISGIHSILANDLKHTRGPAPVGVHLGWNA